MDPRHAKRYESDGPSSIRDLFVENGGYVAIIILLLLVAAEVGGFFYGKIANRLDREGIITDATVLDVQTVTVSNHKGPGSYTSGYTYWTITKYEFQSESGDKVVDESKSKVRDNTPTPKVGSTFSVCYAASDPSVHEARVDHYQSNTDALHLIAAFFAGVTFLYIAICWWKAVKQYRGSEQHRLRAKET